jgi:hypothetical protein
VIPQFGRVWREPTDSGWSRAAFPLMLVNDTENHAHQGLATFLYRDGEVSGIQFQFVQQNAPYLLSPHCVFWGAARTRLAAGDATQRASRAAHARRELAERLPVKPLAELRAALAPGTLDGFGGPLRPEWRVALGLVYRGTLYYEAARTAQGDYPYPLEMRFGVRSVTKAVSAALALLRLAQVYGSEVLDLHIGDYVPGLDSKWKRVRFIDAANMATGFGGSGSNDSSDDQIKSDYDAWYTAPSHAQKLRLINAQAEPYPWEPGKFMRYRDQDFYLLRVAVDSFLQSKRGPGADIWHMLEEEVFAPIGIRHAPVVRTRESGGREGSVWFSAGYYPTLDDLAKIALLFADGGEHAGKQLLHRGLTEELIAGRGAIAVEGDAGAAAPPQPGAPPPELYHMGFFYTAFKGSRSGGLVQLPTMSGFGKNEVIIYPGRIVSICAGKAATWRNEPGTVAGDLLATPRAVDRLAPF